MYDCWEHLVDQAYVKPGTYFIIFNAQSRHNSTLNFTANSIWEECILS